MPLVWAHAEYVKLCRSLAEGRVFDMPPQTVERYQVSKVGSPHVPWRFNHECGGCRPAAACGWRCSQPALVHWSSDGWRTVRDTATRDTGIGLHVADLPPESAPVGARVDFTFFWPGARRWEGCDFAASVVPASQSEGGTPMTDLAPADAFVFFGATGDLAYKKIFPALQAMIRRGHLDVPIIGVAKAGWDLDRFRERARASLEEHGGGVDPAAFAKLCTLLRYVDGDYNDRGDLR